MKFHLSIWNSTQVIGFWKIQSRKSTTSGYRKSLKSWYGSTILIKYLYMKFHQPSCNGTQVIVFTHRQTDRQTDTHTQTHRHTDKIAKLCFSVSVRCKTSRFVKISIFFLHDYNTFSILRIYEKVKIVQVTRNRVHTLFWKWN